MFTQQTPAVAQLAKNRMAIMEKNRREHWNKMHPFQPLSDVMRDGEWQGQRCFIIGGGPSLIGFDFDRLHGQGRTIAINRAYEACPFADILFFMDRQFYENVHKNVLRPDALALWEAFQGRRVFLNIMGREFADVYSVRSLGRIGLSSHLTAGLYHGNNSGVGALGLAYALGASPIYLLGFDCKFNAERRSHWHDGYRGLTAERVLQSFAREFERLNRFLRRTTTLIYNLNPDSGLRCFPFKNLEEVLGNGKTGQSLGDDDGTLPGQAGLGPCA